MNYTTEFLKGKCKPESLQTVKFILLTDRYHPVIAGLIQNLIENMKKSERLDVYEWSGSRWYIEVCDPTIPYEQRIWFTVDINEDYLISNEKSGNCGLRDRRWYKFMKTFYSGWVAGAHFHKYIFQP